MKKLFSVLLVLALLVSLAGCGDKNNGEAQKTAPETEAAEKFDVDLTALSSTMVYSEVNNMVTKPEKYIGKSVKMGGSFSVYHDDVSGKNYFACLIADATACCSQGIEFTLKDETKKYPEDYPELGKEITVTGIFNTYYEGENRYCQLVDAVMETA